MMKYLGPNVAISSVYSVALLFLGMVFVILTYIWFISFGSWTNWPMRTAIYDQMATAFIHGKLSIERVPDPMLLRLEDPYNPKARAGFKYPQDVSLYEGKYYYYFGPVPALLLMVPKLWTSRIIGDQYLTFAFISGIFIIQSLLIIRLWKRFFQQIPTWIVLLCILFAGLISPFTWILGQAAVYIAASAGGQFFFLLGFYFIINALDRDVISAIWLFAGGISWAFALGSRLTQILPVGFVTLMVVFFIIREHLQSRLFLKTMYFAGSIGLPLVLGLGLLGWYNSARFNSFFETGLYYQLAGPHLQKYYHTLFSSKYLLPNLYDYLIMRPKIVEGFPFLHALEGYGAIKFSFVDLPRIYHEGELTGLLFTTPFALFACLPVVSLLLAQKTPTGKIHQDRYTSMHKWIVLSLFGAFLFSFATLTMFFWALTRYLIDCIPSLLLLSVLGFWEGYLFLMHNSIGRRIYVFGGIGLLLISIIISNLLALASTAAQFIKFDPGI